MKTYLSLRWLPLFMLVGLVGLSMLRPAPTYACSCAPPGDPTTELERSAAVFEGTVIAADVAQHVEMKPRRITFAVTNIWKGITTDQVEVITGNGGGDCGFEFEQGREYVVYAYRSEADSVFGEGLATSICSRTNLLEASAEDIMLLGQPTKPVVSTSVAGTGVGATATAAPVGTIPNMSPLPVLGLLSFVLVVGYAVIVLVRRRSA